MIQVLLYCEGIADFEVLCAFLKRILPQAKIADECNIDTVESRCPKSFGRFISDIKAFI
jgi:hypothetical protein